MSSSRSTTAGGVVVVTHVHPAPQGAAQQHCGPLQKFSRSRPLALGTVQIMVGLMILLFGIVMAVGGISFGVLSGIFVWGAVFHIAAGSLTVAAGRHLTRCLVNAALALSVIAAVVSGIGTILYSLDVAGLLLYCYNRGYDRGYNRGYDPGLTDCHRYKIAIQGVLGVLAAFNVLELIVSLTIAGYACNATCNCTQELPSVGYRPAASSAAEAAHSVLEAYASAADFTSEMVDFSGVVSC